MQLLTFTNLYPSRDRLRHGIFVEERLRHLVASGCLSARVLALRPMGAAAFARSAIGARKEPKTELRHDIAVEYVGVPTLPLLTNWIDPWVWARSTERRLRQILASLARSEVILDAHFLYPDGVAAVLLARRLGLPVVMTARGSDVNVKCENAVMRSWIRWAAAHCSALITVSGALAERLTRLEIRAPALEVVPNGVDLQMFRPRDRETVRARLGATKRVVVSVGHLVAAKGHAVAIEAVAAMPDTSLVIVGTGPDRARLQRLAARLGVGARVRFLGLVPHEKMPAIYNGADALVLASANEGMPNVVLESIACGTRVVATDVGGISEVVASDAAGILVKERSAAALRNALAQLFEQNVTVEETYRFARRFSWSSVVEKQLSVYRSVLAGADPQLASPAECKPR